MRCRVNAHLLLTRNYRQIIKTLVEGKIEAGEDINFAKLATEAKIQRTFLSQVVNEKNHLNNDQLFLLCKALKLDQDRIDHLLTLSEWQRCKVEMRKKNLEKKLLVLEKKAIPDEGVKRISGIKPEALDDYFCDPLGEVVLKFLTIDRFRKNPQLLRDRLGLSLKRWEEIMGSLVESQMATVKEGEIILLRDAIYPHLQSPAEKIRNIQGRLKVAEKKLRQRNIDEFMYNWWFLGNPRSKKEIKIHYLHLLERIYQESLSTAHEDVYQISLDLLSL